MKINQFWNRLFEKYHVPLLVAFIVYFIGTIYINVINLNEKFVIVERMINSLSEEVKKINDEVRKTNDKIVPLVKINNYRIDVVEKETYSNRKDIKIFNNKIIRFETKLEK